MAPNKTNSPAWVCPFPEAQQDKLTHPGSRLFLPWSRRARLPRGGEGREGQVKVSLWESGIKPWARSGAGSEGTPPLRFLNLGAEGTMPWEQEGKGDLSSHSGLQG